MTRKNIQFLLNNNRSRADYAVCCIFRHNNTISWRSGKSKRPQCHVIGSKKKCKNQKITSGPFLSNYGEHKSKQTPVVTRDNANPYHPLDWNSPLGPLSHTTLMHSGALSES